MTTAAGTVSVYDRLVWPEGVVERMLASGEQRRTLIAYFGEPEYARLHAMAQGAAAARPDPQRCVYLLPGIMGSQLGLPRERPLPDDLLWIDASDIHEGRLMQLAMPGPPVMACGPVLHGMLPLKLALAAHGYTVRVFAYDWRRDLAETGAVFARVLACESAREVSVVAHSMGGLVARLALRHEAGQRVQRLVTLGTPHGGSFAPVQAIRGVYPLVRRLAQLDRLHTPETLAREVFSSFHSLYQMLPLDSAVDLIDAREWPRTGPQPNATLLDRAPMLRLGGPDPRISAIVGYGYQTPVNIVRVEDDFLYRYDGGGDGTVPAARAALPGCEAWYCRQSHNELPRSPEVHDAVHALLEDAAPRLPGAPPALREPPTSASDRDLRRQFNDKIDWPALDATQRRAFLDSLNHSPPATA